MAISLEKGKKVHLEKKHNAGLGEILVNLNWNTKPAKQGFLAGLLGSKSSGIDLDLGCLYELKNGQKGAIQALGNAFGSLQREPYIALDGDDLSEAVAGKQPSSIHYPGAEDLIVKMDTYNSSDIMCGLVLLENLNDETFSVEKIVQFYQGHQALDRAFHWVLRWTAGRK